MLAQKLILSYGSRVIIQFIQIAVTIVVARVAGPSVIGTIAFGLAFVNMFAFIADLGIPTAYIKSINDGDNEAEANGTFFRIQFILIGLFLFIVLGWLFIQKYVLGYQFESKTHEYVILILLATTVIKRFFLSIKTFFIARTEQAKQDIPDFIHTLLFQLLRLGVVLLGYRAMAIAFSNLAATLVMVPVFLFLFKKYPIGRFNKRLALKYLGVSLPLIIILVSQTVVSQSDKVILQYFSDSKTVGFYTAGFKIGGFVQMIASVIGLLFFPLFTKAITENDVGKINQIIGKFERFLFAFVFPVTVLAAIYSDIIVDIFLGPKYYSSIPILSIITISMFVLTFIQPYGNTLFAKGKFALGAVIYIIQLLTFISLSLIVVHPDILNKGGVGMAYVVLLSNIILGVMFMFFSKRKINNLKVLPSLKLIIFAAFLSVSAFLIYKNLILGIGAKIVLGFVFLMLYWGLGYLFKLISNKEWEMVYNIINFKRMKQYVAGEFKNNKEKENNDKD